MKKTIKIIILLLSFIPLKAKTLELNLTCPKTAYPNTTINCTLTYHNTPPLNAIIFKYNLPSKITYQKINPNNNWSTLYSTKKGSSLLSNTTTNETIANIDLKISKDIEINKEYTIKLTNIDASDTNFNSLTQKDISSTIKIISKPETQTNQTTTPNKNEQTETKEEEQKLDNDSKLKSITLSYGKLNFKPNIFEYFITVPNTITNITIEALPNSDKAKVTIDKPIELTEGNNKITITVEAEDKTTSKYIIIINRELSNQEPTPTNSKALTIPLKYLIPIILLLILILIALIIKTKINNK